MSDSDIGDDIVQDALPVHITPPGALRIDFKPWHKVRKQFIRERQWNHEIKHLVQRLRRELQQEEHEWGAELGNSGLLSSSEIPENVRIERPLRCLMLPGDELLDIRSMWQHLLSEGCYLRFLGFNSSLGSAEKRRQMAITENAVTQLAKVAKDSHVTGDPFQDIAKVNSQAYRLFRQYGPYDVVNLDLCDSLVPRGVANEMTSNYSALHQLLLYQSQHQRGSWLLFMTTQVDRETADQVEINLLASPTRQNCDDHPEFAEALAAQIPEAAFKSQTHSFDISELTANHLVIVFGVLLGKWLINIVGMASPGFSIKLLSSYRYVIRSDKEVEMLSLGFSVIPRYSPPVDSTGISSLRPPAPTVPSELQTALSFVSAAARIRDVDKILSEDASLRERMIKAKADLLSEVGFDPEAFMRWVSDGEPGGA